MKNVTLTPEEYRRAVAIGVERQVIAEIAGWPPRHDNADGLFEGHVRAAVSEFAVAKDTGEPWTGGVVWETPPAERLVDVGDNIEVRWSRDPDGALRFWPHKDRTDVWWVLVTGKGLTVTIVGWIWGGAIAELPFAPLATKEDSYSIPQSWLTPYV